MVPGPDLRRAGGRTSRAGRSSAHAVGIRAGVIVEDLRAGWILARGRLGLTGALFAGELLLALAQGVLLLGLVVGLLLGLSGQLDGGVWQALDALGRHLGRREVQVSLGGGLLLLGLLGLAGTSLLRACLLGGLHHSLRRPGPLSAAACWATGVSLLDRVAVLQVMQAAAGLAGVALAGAGVAAAFTVGLDRPSLQAGCVALGLTGGLALGGLGLAWVQLALAELGLAPEASLRQALGRGAASLLRAWPRLLRLGALLAALWLGLTLGESFLWLVLAALGNQPAAAPGAAMLRLGLDFVGAVTAVFGGVLAQGSLLALHAREQGRAILPLPAAPKAESPRPLPSAAPAPPPTEPEATPPWLPQAENVFFVEELGRWLAAPEATDPQPPAAAAPEADGTQGAPPGEEPQP